MEFINTTSLERERERKGMHTNPMYMYTCMCFPIDVQYIHVHAARALFRIFELQIIYYTVIFNQFSSDEFKSHFDSFN